MHCIHDVQECGTTHIKFCTKVEEMVADKRRLWAVWELWVVVPR